MANITRDSHDDSKNYYKVTIQRGTPPLDSELNEMQDNALVHQAEGLFATMGGKRPSQEGVSEGIIPLEAPGDSLAPFATGSDVNIYLAAGEAYFEGFRIVFADDVDLVASGIVLEAVASANTYGLVYMEVSQREVDSGEDPNIATAELGETSVREQISVRFRNYESATSFDDAMASAVADLSAPAAEDRVWNGAVARVVVCRYYRANGNTNIGNDQLFDLRQSTPNELSPGLPLMAKTHRPYYTAAGSWAGKSSYEGGKSVDGMVVWNAEDSRLVVGHLDGDKIASEIVTAMAYRQGMTVLFPAFHNTTGFGTKAANSRGIERIRKGSTTTDGTAVTKSASVGWNITNGQALGFLTVGTATLSNNSPTRKNGTSALPLSAEAVDVTPDPSTYSATGSVDPAKLLVQRLVVDSMKEFVKCAPHAVVLCRNVNGDLVWFNGQVTRGNPARAVAAEIGDVPLPYDALVSGNGSGHFTNTDGVERAINWLRSTTGRALGLGRHLKINIRRGAYDFVRAINTFGTAAELAGFVTTQGWDAGNNGIELSGEGPHAVKIETISPSGAIGSAADAACLSLIAHKIVLRGIHFKQLSEDSVTPRATLLLAGYDVVLEDCVFEGPVLIAADRVEIRRCHFAGLNGATGNQYYSFSSSVWSPESLSLSFYTSGSTYVRCHHLVEDCTFDVQGDLGCHSKIVLETGSSLGFFSKKVTVRRCEFYYSDDSARMPSIHIDGNQGAVTIEENTFVNANGVGKPGNSTTVTAVPFNADYGGAPLQYIGTSTTTGSTTASGNRLVACGYISCVGNRGTNSRTTIRKNVFDFSNVANTAGAAFMTWGGFIYVFSSLSASATVQAYNIEYEGNHHIMQPHSGWTASGDLSWISGCYIAPAWQNGLAITNVQVCNVKMNDNSFDLGTGGASTWRSIHPENLNAWPAAELAMTDVSCLLGIVLKNWPGGAVANTGRWAVGIEARRNRVYHQPPGGTTVPHDATITLQETLNSTLVPNTSFYGIYFDLAQEFLTGGTSTSEESGTDEGAFKAGTAAFFGPQVTENIFLIPAFEFADATHARSAIRVAALNPIVAHNTVYASHTTDLTVQPVNVTRSLRALVTGNVLTGKGTVSYAVACNAASVNFAGGNQVSGFNDGTTPLQANLTEDYTTGVQIGSNFA